MKKILIGGSPCTYWSISQKPDTRETVAEGLGWELFENYLIALKKFKPDYFLYENNESISKAKEYLRVGYDDDNDYITELIDISEAYIDGCVGTAYREKDKYNSEEEYKRGCRLATLLQKKVISDMYDVRGTTVSNNTKQDKITQTILDKLANVG